MSASAARLVARGRRKAESLMVDECEITETTSATDNPNGTVDKTDQVVYFGPCRIQTYDPYERRANASEEQAIIRRDVLQLPMSATGVSTGQLVEITDSQLDPDLIGRKWRIAAPSRKSHQTMRRLYIEEETQGASQ